MSILGYPIQPKPPVILVTRIPFSNVDKVVNTIYYSGGSVSRAVHYKLNSSLAERDADKEGK